MDKKATPRSDRVLVVPCSGIGKSYGTVTREAAYILAEELRPDQVELLPLSLVVLGDAALKQNIKGRAAITIDGCNLECARKNVSEAGAVVVENFRVLDAYRQHRQLKPQGIAELNEGGLALARIMATEAAAVVDGVQEADHA
ncbi:putative zinc-binding protein [Candidatus Amarolinea aalborgensis]|jgi:uncharacterized metal-binding protein|uniref:putative zinc-binding protein n=1 Tax=Candidatus Amarolinea aalborgensis TaxID=2249329 RepID=UPI003BFA3253